LLAEGGGAGGQGEEEGWEGISDNDAVDVADRERVRQGRIEREGRKEQARKASESQQMCAERAESEKSKKDCSSCARPCQMF